MCDIPDNAMLYVDGHHGRYIPQIFFSMTRRECLRWDCDADTKNWIINACSNPDNEDYWEAWNDAEVTVFDPESGIEYYLWQDGDLWLVPVKEGE